jgi:L-cystine transport system substrate-binding protein
MKVSTVKLAAGLFLTTMFLILGPVNGVYAKGSNDAGAASGVTRIKFGVGSTYAPFCYLDEKGVGQGFEYELLKAIDANLPDVEFVYETAYFANLMLALESGQVDAVAHQVGKNAERQQKFLYGETAYTSSPSYFAVRSDRNDISTLESLQGKVLLLGPTEQANDFVNEFNARHADNPIKVQFKDGTTDANILVATGKVDAAIANPAIIWDQVQRAKLNVKVVGDPVYESSGAYYLFRKDDALKPVIQKIDRAVEELRADGTLRELSIKYLGDDYT